MLFQECAKTFVVRGQSLNSVREMAEDSPA